MTSPGPAARALASPHHELRSHYRVVVIGSGYGGAVVAARLAQRGHEVCVLERGREWHPGEFPTHEVALVRALRNEVTNPLGLFDIQAHLASDVDVISASGLGGTSLLNAAISLRAESIVFEQDEWPAAIRDANRDGSLATYYARAEETLEAAPQTETHAFAKSQRHLAVVRDRGHVHGVLSLNIVHAGKHHSNAHGIDRPACTHCGDCCAGCNVGAKNTLTTNYLPMARRHGARMFTGIEVRALRREGDAFAIDYVHHEDETFGTASERTLTADAVVVAAGSLGSTEILLRSHAAGLSLSPRLGKRFSANGDVLGFGYNGDDPTNVVARHNEWGGANVEPPVGPIITCYADHRVGRDREIPLRDRFLLLDGAVPSALAPLVAGAFATWGLTHFMDLSGEQLSRLRRDLLRREFRPDGAINHSMLYLACGHDDSPGEYRLEDPSGHVSVHWPGFENEDFVRRIQAEMEAHAKRHGAIFFPNPRMALFGGSRLPVTHPLGGCGMGDDSDRGVVDDRGRVYDGNGAVHRGLYVTDAAILPRSLGVTPLLTITALAERCAEAIDADLAQNPSG